MLGEREKSLRCLRQRRGEPWMLYHCEKIFHTLDEAIDHISSQGFVGKCESS